MLHFAIHPADDSAPGDRREPVNPLITIGFRPRVQPGLTSGWSWRGICYDFCWQKSTEKTAPPPSAEAAVSRIEKGLPCRMETQRKILLALGLQLSDKPKIFKD
jgi:hypothetical protein